MRAYRGRTAAHDPRNRFREIEVELDPAELTEADLRAPTRYFDDATRRVIARNSSPDIPFDQSLNPYRGCECGCSYCYARPFHEYLGLSAGLDFERMIFVKRDAAARLRVELAKPSYVPSPFGLSGVTDPYQPIESELGITRQLLGVLRDHRHPALIITKRATIRRDLDLLADLAADGLVHATLSVTSLDAELQRGMEPRASTPQQRLDAVRALADAGVPVSVNVAPAIPGLTDHEIPAILEAAAAAGARRASMIPVRLPGAVQEVFVPWLEREHPLRAQRVLARIREMRGGELNDPRPGHRMRGQGAYAEQMRQIFTVHARRLGLDGRLPPLRTDRFRVPGRTTQESLFGELVTSQTRPTPTP